MSHIGDRVKSTEDGALGRIIGVVDQPTGFYEIENDDGFRWIGLWRADFVWLDEEED